MSQAHLLFGFVVDARAENCPKGVDAAVWLDDPAAAIQNRIGTRLGVASIWGNYYLDRVVVHAVGATVNEGCVCKAAAAWTLGEETGVPEATALVFARRALGLDAITAPIDWYLAAQGDL